MNIDEKLQSILCDIERRTVAVSGGVDSVTLAVFAHRQRPQQTDIAHAVSPAVPGQATELVKQMAEIEGWNLRIIRPGEFSDRNYLKNPPDRCFFCKTHLYKTLHSVIGGTLLSGANEDDLSDYRPGLIAASNHRVRHPFIEAKMGKPLVRQLARTLGLGSIAELPASPCLSSRVESHTPIEPDDLTAIDVVETTLRQRFPGNLRCRIRSQGITVEIDANRIADLSDDDREHIEETVTLAFRGRRNRRRYLGIEPYRMGSAFIRNKVQ
ncbi:hypothetical protein B5K11_28935 [Rhizobium leguminosarum bv. trifolii]|uniref:adenine nucleotide alpha hydrolase n=1 Tax=Rhizobium leguminosarum TaxID=384 RepID=UPI000E2F8467|nr:adenine nucleotide alpha hydrolase [Rhizobium leguminosarum]RFB86086.1 hypothetical protein B5K11_28935 [Rhizobium leguminosarum bv. trifolii]